MNQSVAEHLTTFIEERYGTTGVQLQGLASSWKEVYHLQRADGADWIVRLFPAADDHSPVLTVAKQAALLGHLARHTFPAERVVLATDGSAVTGFADRPVLITTYLGSSLQAWHAIYGQTELGQAGAGAGAFDYAPATLHAWGATLGQLHSLPVDRALALPITNERPRPQLTWAAENLANLAEQVPPALQADYQDLTHLLHTIDHCEDVPFTLIHGDCGLGNAILLPTGQIALIDWDWAGLGPAVVDIGWLLSNCFDKAQWSINPAAVAAIVEGYCQQRHPTPAEVERLTAATQFHTLKLLVGFFPERMEDGWSHDRLIYGVTYATWRAQFAASGEIASVAQECFARCGALPKCAAPTTS